ncbi:hypothetical protein BN903_63 [Halorubrum sp. AJ67]|nr:hypothetical protein BN903_63 [Halorubrum sp. AJ67]
MVGGLDGREAVVALEQRLRGPGRVLVGDVLREESSSPAGGASPGSAVGSAPCSAARSTGSYSDTRSS